MVSLSLVDNVHRSERSHHRQTPLPSPTQTLKARTQHQLPSSADLQTTQSKRHHDDIIAVCSSVGRDRGETGEEETTEELAEDVEGETVEAL